MGNTTSLKEQEPVIRREKISKDYLHLTKKTIKRILRESHSQTLTDGG
jgi:uncharacterized protein (DUF433 family)